jgi:hypothetical protein
LQFYIFAAVTLPPFRKLLKIPFHGNWTGSAGQPDVRIADSAKCQLPVGRMSTNQLKVQIVRPLQDKAVAKMAVSGLLRSVRKVVLLDNLPGGKTGKAADGETP